MGGRGGPRAAIVVLYATLAALVAGAGIVAGWVGVPLSLLTRDVFSVAAIPVYTSLFSNLGAFLWSAAVTVCLFAWRVAPGGRKDAFLPATAAFTAVLMADDFWMFHEWIAPRFLGVSENVVMAVYGVLAAAYAVHYRARIQRTAAALFVVAGILFALVVGIDVVEPEDPAHWYYYMEDGLKLFGIGTWLAFCASAAAAAFRSDGEEGGW